MELISLLRHLNHEQAGEWLTDQLALSDSLNVSFTKTKISFKGCSQREYRLAFVQEVTSGMELEAVIHYEEGKLDFGLTDQKVSSQAYEMISWWQMHNYRLGLGKKVVARHDIVSPLATGFTLPKSEAVAVYIELPGLFEAHTVAFAAIQESWTAQEDMSLPWRTSRDNQLNVNYTIAF
ncbi:hypothetical protein CA267_007395 [Alteromonas pelagimontana]|uniref:Uncharacterized protein n=1 Tax=Alteromonas pelagimontana TaxID=1858656 RepID=A0A6M4MBN4_9ALTE|nr:hypothetical protein [Alteromonas pelagimontana]QJR80614.1 hypothetical protein CA267_007395 [Alteromonas pelagimontana]